MNNGLKKLFLCELIETKILYALKAISKMEIINSDNINHVKIERKLLQEFKHPFLLYLDYAFHDDDMIYFILPFIQGGDLFTHLKRENRFKEERVKFYAA